MMIINTLKVMAFSLLLLAFCVFTFAYLSPRPPLTTDPVTLAGDGSTYNYCELPKLDSSGLMAAEIPKGNTPGCAYSQFPLPILRECAEPLAKGADDIRGLWRAVEGARTGHVERVEQCGARTVITSSGIIHDYGPNSTAGLNTNDTEGNVLFTAGARAFCMRTSASMIWESNKLNFYVFGWGPQVVSRYREGEYLVWEYADGSVNKMERLCELPQEHKVPRARGRRFKLF
jgi:hypothetical protein